MDDTDLMPFGKHKGEPMESGSSDALITFFVPGIPKTAGSKRAFIITPKGGGRPRAIVTDDCQASRDWKGDVKRFAADHARGLIEGPRFLTLTFYLSRPQFHFGSGKNASVVKPGAPMYPIGRPDVLKLARAVEDACTAVLWADDAQIVHEVLLKRYVGYGFEPPRGPGVLVEVEHEL
jgi:Holliday junction resolvase RusA-like endonuclease